MDIQEYGGTTIEWYASHPFTPSSTDYVGNAFRYLLTGEATYARYAINWLMTVILDTSRPGDDARWVGEDAIHVYDWCYDQLTESERQTLITRWNGFITGFNTHSWGGPSMPENNYFWGFFRNNLAWGIASFWENSQAQSFIDNALVTRWEQSFLPFAMNEENGGVPLEGSQYGTYHLRYPVVPFVTVSLNGRNLYDETRFFRGSVYYMIYSTTPALTRHSGSTVDSYDLFPFGDDENWLNGNSAKAGRSGDMMTALAGLWPDRPVGQHARRWLNVINPQRTSYIEAVDSITPALGFENLPVDYYAPGPGSFFVRNQWGPNATSIIFQMHFPVNSGHQHLDAGSFQIWRNGRWLSRESVSYVDLIAGARGISTVDARKTHGHNGVLFNGLGLANGYFDGQPQVTRLESRADYSFAAVDLSASYRARASNYPNRDDNPFAGTAVREFIFIRPLETTVVFDRLQSSSDSFTRTGWTGEQLEASAVPKSFLLHFEQNPILEDSSHVLGINGAQALRVSTLVPSAPVRHVVAEGGSIGQYRLELETVGATQSYFINVLQARGVSEANVDASVVESANSYTVTLVRGSERAVITLQKGMTSIGGSISIASAAAQAFTNSVQSIVVGDNGPVWGQ